MNDDASWFAVEFDVSRETISRLQEYLALLERWNRSINMVSTLSLQDAWRRHFADSAQLWAFRPASAASWLDLGSGAGFPGLVIAVIAAQAAPGVRVTLVESDERKMAFLGTVARCCGVHVTLCRDRIETLDPQAADVVTARALAPLDALLGYAERHRHRAGICLFPKGRTVHKEIVAASAGWRFDYRLHPSRTEPAAAILEVGAILRV